MLSQGNTQQVESSGIEPQDTGRSERDGASNLCGRRLLLVTSNFPRWTGDSTTPFILNLAQDLQDLGWRIQVLAPHAAGSARFERLEGIAVERFRYLWPASAQTVCYNGGALINLRSNRLNLLKVPALVLAEIAKIAQRLSRGQFDLVHSHWVLPQGFSAGLVARSMGVPHVGTVHGGDVFALRGRALTAFKRLSFRLADAVTVNSSATREAVTRIGHGDVPVVTIPMGASPPAVSDAEVSVVRARYRQGNGPLVIFVGRLIEEKGVADLLDAIAILRGNLPNITMLIVGEGADRLAFEERARSLGIADAVHFLGWVAYAEIGGLLRASDIFVAPSKRSANGWVEAQGLTIVEAMLAGVPVVATATGGITDMVRDDDTGLLVPEACPPAIAAAVGALHCDPGRRLRLVASARIIAERDYTRRASARRFSELFEEVIRRRRTETC